MCVCKCVLCAVTLRMFDKHCTVKLMYDLQYVAINLCPVKSDQSRGQSGAKCVRPFRHPVQSHAHRLDRKARKASGPGKLRRAVYASFLCKRITHSNSIRTKKRGAKHLPSGLENCFGSVCPRRPRRQHLRRQPARHRGHGLPRCPGHHRLSAAAATISIHLLWACAAKWGSAPRL